jgi:hypothetical protein
VNKFCILKHGFIFFLIKKHLTWGSICSNNKAFVTTKIETPEPGKCLGLTYFKHLPAFKFTAPQLIFPFNLGQTFISLLHPAEGITLLLDHYWAWNTEVI